MKFGSTLILFGGLTIALSSCVQEPASTDEKSAEVQELENRVAQLELDNSLKDSVINESLAFFNEIQANLDEIGVHKDEIRLISDNPEMQPDDKERILEQIRHINFLREDNARKVNQLNAELKKSNLKISELETMVETLMRDIKWKDQQIELLQNELESLDVQYSKLFDAYQEQSLQIDHLKYKLNSVYYAYGSEDELLENKIIEKKNGFIGLGKKVKLNTDFAKDYFTETDATTTNTITIRGKDALLISAHPASSYEMVVSGAVTKINILDPSEFWKITKYLVVLVD